MAKQILKIDQFHGGVNSSADARDIADNELAQANEIMVDEIGKVKLLGGTSTSGVPAANTAAIKDATTDFGTGVKAIEQHTKGKIMNKSTQETFDWAEQEGW